MVVRGDRGGREIDYPTANVQPLPWSAVPADGVYAGRLVHAGEQLPTAVSIGTNPTFAGRERRVEAYVLDAPADLDLYGEQVGVAFLARLRETLAFPSVGELVEQTDVDAPTTLRKLCEQLTGSTHLPV